MRKFIVHRPGHEADHIEADEIQLRDGHAVVLRYSEGLTGIVGSYAPGAWVYFEEVAKKLQLKPDKEN